jgi:hypothetical protein
MIELGRPELTIGPTLGALGFAHAVATRDARYATDPSAMVDEARRILSRESARRRRRRSGSRHSGSTA